MPCHAMHPMQDLSLESFSYELQFDMHFDMHSYLHKIFILVKCGCYIEVGGRMGRQVVKSCLSAPIVGWKSEYMVCSRNLFFLGWWSLLFHRKW
jgi:hypothetical protein